MLVIFRNNFEERLINTDKISAIWQDTTNSTQPYFRVEYIGGGGFGFNSLEWNGYFRGTPMLKDVTLALMEFEEMNKEVKG